MTVPNVQGEIIMDIKKGIKRFVLYTGASTVAMIVDLFLFIIFAEIIFRNINANVSILVSTIIARVTSSIINFKLSKIAFNSKDLKSTAFLRFFALIGLQLLMSAVFVMIIYRFIEIPKTIIKCIVDTTLYFVFYKINSKFVFKNKQELYIEEDAENNI